jgi:hypothetical protein
MNKPKLEFDPDFLEEPDKIEELAVIIYPKFLEDLTALALIVQKASFNFTEEEQEIENMSYSLISTPEDDVLSFTQLYAVTQGLLTRTNSILIKVLQTKREWIRFRRESRSMYKKAMSKLLGREDIQKLKNQELRVSAAEDEIRQLVDLKDHIDGVVDDLDSLVEVIKIRSEDLSKANVNLRSQQEIVLFLPTINYPVRVQTS